ncbi:hypothetical protein NDU88_006907 [Pleurodeles waltl]|uniref:Uncharacterized protein n=1 Tax=Pleurodeles waltl TaxID=8319 RepID=A0AAV7QM50_PLEWA|nr:hypothetical protein NDU88_006907 [Pleurodeles waltl]
MLLGCRTAEQLNLISFAFSVHLETVESLVTEFKSLFEGIGCLKDRMLRLHIDKFIQPVALKHCRVAFHLRPKVEEELRKLEQADVIEKVDGPTPWVLGGAKLVTVHEADIKVTACRM